MLSSIIYVKKWIDTYTNERNQCEINVSAITIHHRHVVGHSITSIM